MQILIGVDGSPYSDAAVEEVAQRRWPDGAEIRVVQAVVSHAKCSVEVVRLPLATRAAA
jgi:nucleotide-binding universal stress UspA family protein